LFSREIIEEGQDQRSIQIARIIVIDTMKQDSPINWLNICLFCPNILRMLISSACQQIVQWPG
jgi:hypothetical protein